MQEIEKLEVLEVLPSFPSLSKFSVFLRNEALDLTESYSVQIGEKNVDGAAVSCPFVKPFFKKL